MGTFGHTLLLLAVSPWGWAGVGGLVLLLLVRMRSPEVCCPALRPGRGAGGGSSAARSWTTHGAGNRRDPSVWARASFLPAQHPALMWDTRFFRQWRDGH